LKTLTRDRRPEWIFAGGFREWGKAFCRFLPEFCQSCIEFLSGSCAKLHKKADKKSTQIAEKSTKIVQKSVKIESRGFPGAKSDQVVQKVGANELFFCLFWFLGDFLGPKMAEKSNKKREFRRPFFVWFLKLVLFLFLSILGPKTTAKSKKKGPEIESGNFVKKCVSCRRNNDFQGSGVSKNDQNWRKSEGENERGKKTANVRKTVDFGAPKRARNRTKRVRKPTKKALEKKS
jgi:hypothetical protein